MNRILEFLVPLFLLALLLSCGRSDVAGTPEIDTESAWVRAMPLIQGGEGARTNSAAYLTILNRGDAPDRLLGAEMPDADRVEIHESVLVDDVMRMRRLDAIEIPAEGSTMLTPGGIHLMLLGISRPMAEGEEVDLTLRFERFGDLTVTVPVLDASRG